MSKYYTYAKKKNSFSIVIQFFRVISKTVRPIDGASTRWIIQRSQIFFINYNNNLIYTSTSLLVSSLYIDVNESFTIACVDNNQIYIFFKLRL